MYLLVAIFGDRRINQFAGIFDLIEEVPVLGEMLPIVDEIIFVDENFGLEVGLRLCMPDEDNLVLLLIMVLHHKYFYKQF